jgi:RimJ/RimL family protein N-acetyltransferase
LYYEGITMNTKPNPTPKGATPPGADNWYMKTYPKKIHLKDGREVTVRPMVDTDLEASYSFFKSLPEDVRVYLRQDVTKREVVERRMGHDDMHCFCRIVVLVGDRIVGDATLYQEPHSWKKHVGEVRLIIHPEYQHAGLGNHLIHELYEIANAGGLELLFCALIEEQVGTIKALEKLGFKKELVKKGHVRDIKGKRHDLVIMTCNLGELWHRLEILMLDMDMGQA